MVGSLPSPELLVSQPSRPHDQVVDPSFFSGDLLMALAWSLPTKFDTPITYFYVMYFTVLLMHRQLRDDEACEEK